MALNRPTFKAILIGSILTFGTVGCGNSTEPEESGTTGVKYTFAVSNTSLPKTLNSLTFTNASIRVIELVFDAVGPNGSISITEPLTSTIDLINNVATPEMPIVNLGPGTYTSLNMGLEIRDLDEDPGIVVEGSFNDTENNSTLFSFLFNSGEVFETDADQLVIPEGSVMEAKITFYPAEWFRGITAQNMLDATKDSIGVVVISGSSNTGLFEIMAAALDSSTQATFPGAIQDE
ncbi:MAG: hypothetical protein IIA59_13730 [Candidatus Marinimicrobia bacterium]|nr:hypothetical protein [Candidatus Neomarinimicrobiota bacterium]